MNLDLVEKKLSSQFCREDVVAVSSLIKSSISFSVVGLPGMGISIFLRYLASRDFYYFIHIDINELPGLSKKELFKYLVSRLGQSATGDEELELLEQIKVGLSRLVQEHQRVVLVFNRFDRLQKVFDQNFFANLRSLRDIDKEKLVMIFAANKPLVQLAEKHLSGGNLNMFSHSYYLKPFSPEDLRQLVQLNTPHFFNKLSDELLLLSGGHYQLLQLLLKSEYQNQWLDDPLIKLQLKELFQYFNPKQRMQLQKLVVKKPVTSLDPLLFSIGIINQVNQLFTPLFSQFIKEHIPLKLAAKEAQLFQLLNKRSEQLVSKELLFETLWPDDLEHQTDWALNSLMYRLKKNPIFKVKGYLIENYKKQGYVLHKH